MNPFFALRHNAEGQQLLARLIATKCVRRGAQWLNRKGPKGWFRNCLNGGRSRIHMAYGNEGILGIVFEYYPEFADNSGYINEGKVLRHFGLWAFSRNSYRLGFDSPLTGAWYKRYPDLIIDDHLLDRCWAELLENPPAEWRIPYRHQTALDRRFAEHDFLEEKQFKWFDPQRFFRRNIRSSHIHA